jgi:Flp pilus assembly protein TadD
LSSDPITSEGAIAVELGDAARARAAFRHALEIQNDWYPRLEIALLDAEEGSFAVALQELDKAAKLDVDDPLIAQARTMMEHRQRIDPVEFNQGLDQGPQASFFAPQNIK